MSRHPKETTKLHMLQIAVILFGALIWFYAQYHDVLDDQLVNSITEMALAVKECMQTALQNKPAFKGS